MHEILRQIAPLKELFKEPKRGEKFSLKCGEIFCDFSKNRLDEAAFCRLKEVVSKRKIQDKIAAMQEGAKVNQSEKRASLHYALRASLAEQEAVAASCDARGEGEIAAQIRQIPQVLEQIRRFSEAVRSGEWQLSGGRRVKNVVNIGIGGSDLGVAMAVCGLREFQDKNLNIHFVSNADLTQLREVLSACEAQETLFVVVSKTFTTQETMLNANAAKRWLEERLGNEAVGRHFVAASTNKALCKEFGISKTFEFFDFVGGRFSVWSAVGLSLCIAVGWENFAEFLVGAREVDLQFFNAEFEENLPLILGAIDYCNALCGVGARAVLAYPYALRLFPAFLEQLCMESNGKDAFGDFEEFKKAGLPAQTKSKFLRQNGVFQPSSPVVFGACGSNAQHAFMQLVHQSSEVVATDFITLKGEKVANANALSQAKALAFGQDFDEALSKTLEKNSAQETGEARFLAHSRIFTGNRPSNFFVLENLTPKSLGSLIAIFEHRVFVEGLLLGVNSFDQFGVELGKEICSLMLNRGEKREKLDSSTEQLRERLGL